MARPNDDQLAEVTSMAYELQDLGRNPYPGMTYLEGVIAGIEWATGMTEDPPVLGEDYNHALEQAIPPANE